MNFYKRDFFKMCTQRGLLKTALPVHEKTLPAGNSSLPASLPLLCCGKHEEPSVALYHSPDRNKKEVK